MLIRLVERSSAYILERVRRESVPEARLNAFIEASLAYQTAYPDRCTALIEIVFNARTPDNVPYYKLNDEGDEDPELDELKRILRDGQETGVFGSFRVEASRT